MKRMRALIVVAATVAVGVLSGCNVQPAAENRAEQLQRDRNALLAEQNEISREHAHYPFGRNW